MPKPVNLIVACAENRVIGRGGRLPWRIAEDWEFFRRQTTGQIVILGRLSFEAWTSIGAEQRQAIVITHNTGLAGPHARTARSLDAALALAEDLPGEIYVCGGERLFTEALALPQAQRLYLTLVHANPPGDRFFPEWREAFPRLIERREGHDETWQYTFFVLGR